MTKREKSFQNYFMTQIDHGYRISLINGGGFPDVLIIAPDGIGHYLVELKILELGRIGDKLIKTLFQKSQPPWYWNYENKNGRRQYVVFRLSKGYGILKITKQVLSQFEYLAYSHLQQFDYKVFPTLKELINECFI